MNCPACQRENPDAAQFCGGHELASIFKIGKQCVMLDREARGIIARGVPRELREQTTDPRVRRFFNRESEGVS